MKGDGHNLAKRESDVVVMLGMALFAVIVAAGILWLVLAGLDSLQSLPTVKG